MERRKEEKKTGNQPVSSNPNAFFICSLIVSGSLGFAGSNLGVEDLSFLRSLEKVLGTDGVVKGCSSRPTEDDRAVEVRTVGFDTLPGLLRGTT